MNTVFHHPVLRADVTIYPVEAGRALVHHEPSNRYFELPPAGAALLALFDGQRGYAEICRNYARKDAPSLSEEELQRIAEDNFRHFLLFPEGQADLGEDLISQAPSYLKLNKVVISSQAVSRFSQYLKVFFRPGIMCGLCLAFLVLFTLAITTYWGQLWFYFESAPLTNLGLFIACMIAATILHEFGHASACEYFGVEHGGIGVGFYLLSPVMFADVTAAWRLPPKKRIVINFAGMYFELLLCNALLLTLFITANPIFLGLALILLFHLVFNLNPFFRTDGYWIMSDLLNLPNLRARSSALLTGTLFKDKRAGYGLAEWLLVFYAGVSYLFIGVFLYYILFQYEGSLLNFGDAFSTLLQDYRQGRPMTISVLFDALQTVFIPILFYYMLIKMAIIPLYRKFVVPSLRAKSITAGVVSVLLLTSFNSCGYIQIELNDEPVSNYRVDNPSKHRSLEFITERPIEHLDSLLANELPVFLDFYATWCRPCKIMDRGTLSDARVIDCLMENYYRIKVDIDSPAGRELKKRYNIQNLPTYLFISAGDLAPRSLIGAVSVDRLLNTCSP